MTPFTVFRKSIKGVESQVRTWASGSVVNQLILYENFERGRGNKMDLRNLHERNEFQ